MTAARDDARRHGDADHGERERRPDRQAQHGKMRLEPAIEQDRREAHAADQVGGIKVVERDAAQSVLASQHAEHEEHQKDRGPDAARDKTGKYAKQAKRRGDQDHLMGEFHVGTAEGNQFR